jgi:hypothetical protein
VPIDDFVQHNKTIFSRDDIEPDTYKPLLPEHNQNITERELQHVLKHKYNAGKSRGLSRMPPQLLKFLGSAGIRVLASFLSESAIS